MGIQWHIFPLQLIAMLLAYFGSKKIGIYIMMFTMVLAIICFKFHATDILAINL